MKSWAWSKPICQIFFETNLTFVSTNKKQIWNLTKSLQASQAQFLYFGRKQEQFRLFCDLCKWIFFFFFDHLIPTFVPHVELRMKGICLLEKGPRPGRCEPLSQETGMGYLCKFLLVRVELVCVEL